MIDQSEKQKILQVLKFLNTLVVSLDRIGSYSATKEIAAQLVVKFIDDFSVVREAAQARLALSEFFDDEIPEGQNESELESLLQDVKYWNAPK